MPALSARRPAGPCVPSAGTDTLKMRAFGHIAFVAHKAGGELDHRGRLRLQRNLEIADAQFQPVFRLQLVERPAHADPAVGRSRSSARSWPASASAGYRPIWHSRRSNKFPAAVRIRMFWVSKTSMDVGSGTASCSLIVLGERRKRSRRHQVVDRRRLFACRRRPAFPIRRSGLRSARNCARACRRMC